MFNKNLLGSLFLLFAASSSVYAVSQNYVTGFLGVTKSGFNFDMHQGNQGVDSSIQHSQNTSFLEAVMWGGNIGFLFSDSRYIEYILIGGGALTKIDSSDTVPSHKVIRSYLSYKLSSAVQETYRLYGKVGVGVSYIFSCNAPRSDGSRKENLLLPSVLLEFGMDYYLQDTIAFNVKVGLSGTLLFAGLGISYHF
jgi:hypothetical protein